jgi:hypothetical protein
VDTHHITDENFQAKVAAAVVSDEIAPSNDFFHETAPYEPGFRPRRVKSGAFFKMSSRSLAFVIE